MTLDEANINWSNFYQANTGLKFSFKKDGCKVFVPTYPNIVKSNIPSLSGTNMSFQDEWSSHSFIVDGSPAKINAVLLEQLYTYASNNIVWNAFNDTLSFNDINVESVTLEQFVANLDTFLVFNKLAKFGNVWWSARVTSDMQGSNTAYPNVYVANVSGASGPGATTSLSFWSPDKYLNDEYKTYTANPLSYTGFLTGNDFSSGGWFAVPDLTISTPPFETLKIAQILLNINYVFDPTKFGDYYTVQSTFGSRIQDLTSQVVFDSSEIRANQNSGEFSDTLVNHWVGGLTSTANIQTIGTIGSYFSPTCDVSGSPQSTTTDVSHLIAGQITLNPNFNPNTLEVLGTIDSINWRSTDSDTNYYDIGILNVDRAFGGANGTIDGGLVFGGVQKTQTSPPQILETLEIWNGNGFIANILVQSNTPRCFHVQGGDSNGSMAVVGGYSEFNTDDPIQFGEYGKTGVLGGMEIFIKQDDIISSYFSTIPNFTLNVPRGDGAGNLTVSTQSRVNKFDAVSALEGYPINQNSEQTINDFILAQSGEDDSKRYTVSNINGFMYCGNSSGNSYMSSTDNNDVLDSFETIQTVFIDVGVTNESLINPAAAVPNGQCQEIIQNVVTVNGTNGSGTAINVTQCGKFRLTYLNGAAQRGAPVITTSNSGLFSSSGIGNFHLPGLPSLNQIANSVFKITGITPPSGILGDILLPFLPLNLFGTGISTGTTTLGLNPYSIRLRVYVNQVLLPELGFNFPDQNTIPQLQVFLQENPGYKTYDFCVPYANSVITCIFDTSNPQTATGFVNYQLCYLGQIDSCTCPSTAAPSITNVAISYTTINPNLQYPVPCHGLVYAGTQSSGLSTGGRCERKSIDTAVTSLLNKYSTGYQVIPDYTETQDELTNSRVLDLVYQFNGSAWVRRQNMIESVYYHTGIGDDTNSIFFGGIHDSITDFTFSYNNQISGAPTPIYDDWNCDNKIIKLVEEDITSGQSYVPQLSGSACWQPPTWASVSSGLLFDDPTYVNVTDAAYLGYANDVNFPPINVVSLTEDNSLQLMQQTFDVLDFDFTAFTLDVSAAISPIQNVSGPSSQFSVTAITITGNSTMVGTWEFDNLFLTFGDTGSLYPANITGSLENETKTMAITEIDNNTDSVDISYNIQHYFNYYQLVTTTTTTGTSASIAGPYGFAMNGVGAISFPSLNSIWTQSVSANACNISADAYISTDVNVMLVVSNVAPVSANPYYINGSALAKFTMPTKQGVMIGVTTTNETFASSLETCGTDVTSLLNINGMFGDETQRWGVPLWNAAFNQGSSFSLNYDFNTRESVSNGNVGKDDYAITTISASSASLAAIVNNRVLIQGTQLEQIHNFSSINGAGVPTVSPSASGCETVIPNISASFTIAPSGTTYSEWATSFVQEYYNDERYSIPQVYITSNGYDVSVPNQGILYQPSAWKRFMDGVGLGGDAPDYDSIYNTTLRQINSVSNWNQIGTWNVGQMAFGTPEKAVIVGGHKINRNVGVNLFGSGLHSSPTTERVFIWDFTTIPKEDTYLTNYLGRRFFSYFINPTSTTPISANGTKSDLNCIIYDAASDIIVERFGTAVFDGSSNTTNVSFTTPMPDANYSIALTPSDGVNVWWSNKTASGFTLTVQVSVWKGTVDYLATEIQTVTESDITGLGELDGYNFTE